MQVPPKLVVAEHGFKFGFSLDSVVRVVGRDIVDEQVDYAVEVRVCSQQAAGADVDAALGTHIARAHVVGDALVAVEMQTRPDGLGLAEQIVANGAPKHLLEGLDCDELVALRRLGQSGLGHHLKEIEPVVAVVDYLLPSLALEGDWLLTKVHYFIII